MAYGETLTFPHILHSLSKRELRMGDLAFTYGGSKNAKIEKCKNVKIKK